MNRNEAPERTPAAPVNPSDPFDALVDIADGLLASVKAPLNEATVNSLCLVFGQTAVLSALDLIDHDEGLSVPAPCSNVVDMACSHTSADSERHLHLPRIRL